MLETQSKWYIPAWHVLGWHIGLWNLLAVLGLLFVVRWARQVATLARIISRPSLHFGAH
jgi:hypothetical protein